MRASLGRLRDAGVADDTVQLSGGVDSSICAALASKIFPRCTALMFQIDDFAKSGTPPRPGRCGTSRSSGRRRPGPVVRRSAPSSMDHRTSAGTAPALQQSRGRADARGCTRRCSDVIAGDFDSLSGTKIIGRVGAIFAAAIRPGREPRFAALSPCCAFGDRRLERAAARFDSSVPEWIRRSARGGSHRRRPRRCPLMRAASDRAKYFEDMSDARRPLKDAAVLFYSRHIAGA